MIKRICNRCGRLYEDICPCRKDIKREYTHDNFYNSKRWVALSKSIKIRDYYSDRLAMYLQRSVKPQRDDEDRDVYKLLREYLIDAYGGVRYLSGPLLVHHIIERNVIPQLEYTENNLISVSFYTHEYIHQLYKTGHKEEVQTILKNAVNAKMP